MAEKIEKHDENFYEQEDKAAANIGRDDAPLGNPKKDVERSQQASYEEEKQQERIRDEEDTERLFQLMKQEGVIEGTREEYESVWNYITSGLPSSEKERDFFKKAKEIDDRDVAGEWGEWSHYEGSGEPIPKAVKKEKGE